MTTQTVHWKDRKERNDFIKNQIGIGNPIRTFKWDKGHPNGPELHTITDTGIIIIRNERTKRLVTTLIARPGQIYRYYINENEVPPKFLMKIAKEHLDAGFNYK
jgi:hypothetical protein